MTKIFFFLYNYVDFFLRQLFHWNRKGLIIKDESKNNLFSDIPFSLRQDMENDAKRLLKNYHLETLYNQSSVDNYRENLYYLELLERAFEISKISLAQEVYAADIGTSHWFYVHSLYTLLQRYHTAEFPRKVFLTGYEEDAFRIYRDFYSRYDHAIAHIGGLQNVKLIPRKFEQRSDYYDIITMLFPFVFIRDHLTWGLPYTHFLPQKLLEDAWLSLKPNGVLIVVNQGEHEHIEELKNMMKLGIKPLEIMRYTSIYYSYELDRYVTISIRNF